MRILCAWCCHEGQPGYLGEREPLDNPAPTHGVCAHHKAQVLASLHREMVAAAVQGPDAAISANRHSALINRI
jgi:hypothetical protein